MIDPTSGMPDLAETNRTETTIRQFDVDGVVVAETGGDVPVTGLDPLTGQVIANTLKIRKSRNLTQEDLAAAMRGRGVLWVRTIVANLESGRRGHLTVAELAALGDVFGMDPWALTQPLPPCETCHGNPPVGFSCRTCGTGA